MKVSKPSFSPECLGRKVAGWLSLALMCLFGLVTGGSGQTAVWTNGTGNSSWASSGNWSTGSVPGAGTAVWINGAGLTSDQTIDLGGDQTIDSLTFNDNQGRTITLNNHNLTLTGAGIALSNSSGWESLLINANVIAAHDITLNSDLGYLQLAGNLSLGAHQLTLTGGGAVQIDGTISGSGGVTIDANANLVYLNGSSTYTGATSIASQDGVGFTTLYAANLANGGQASSIGASSNAAANLVLNAGTLSYVGNGASTDRLFTLGTGGGGIENRGQGVLNFTNTGAVVLAGTDTARTFYLTNQSAPDSIFAPILGDNGSGKTSLYLSGSDYGAGTGAWILTGANTYTGTTTIRSATLTVSWLANGGQISNIGASANAAANLVIDGAGTLRYIGAGGSTDRLFTLGGTSFGGVLDASGTGAIQFTNPGDIVLGGNPNNSLELMLTGTNTGANTLAAALGHTAGGYTYLVKRGTGSWMLTGDSTYNGGTTIEAGTLVTAGSSALGTGAVAVASGSTLQLQGNITVANALTLNGSGTASNGALENVSGNNTASGAITLGSATRINSDAGTLTLSNTVANGGYGLTLGGAGNSAANGVISGTGSLTKDGTGTATLTGTNTYTGATSINGGILSVASLGNGGTASGIGASSSAASNLVLNGGTLQYVGGSDASTDRLFSLGASGGTVTNSAGHWIDFTNQGSLGFSTPNVATTLTLTTADWFDAGSFAPQIRDNGTGATSLAISGPGEWDLTGANTYTGSTTLTGGYTFVTLLANGGVASSVGASSNAAANLVLNGAELDYTGTGTSSDRLFTIGPGGATIANWGSGNLLLTNTGAIALSGLNQARTLTLMGSGYSGNLLAASLGDSGTGATSLTMSNGYWTLSGTNTYTGITTIYYSTLVTNTLANGGVASGIGASSNAAGNLILNGGTLQYTGAATSTDRLFTLGNATGVLDASGTGAVNFTNTGAVAYSTPNTANTLMLQGTNTGSNTLAALLTDNGTGTTSLAKFGTGTWVLTGANTYTGSTTIEAGGILSVATLANGGAASNIGASSNAAANLVLDSFGTLRYTGAGAMTDRLFTLGIGGDTGTSSLDASGSGALVFSNTGSIQHGGSNVARTLGLTGTNTGANTLAAVLGDNGSGKTSLVKTGVGTWVLSGSSSYSGGTAVNAGTLVAAGSTALGTGAVTVATGSTLQLQGNITAPNALTLNGSGTANNGALENVSGNNTASGAITLGSATRIASDAGTLTLSNNLGNSGYALTLGGSGNTAANGVISGNGSLTKDGAGTATLSGANTYTGATTINGGVLSVSSLANGGVASGIGASSNAAANLVLNGGTLQFTGSTTLRSNRLFTLGPAGGTLAIAGGQSVSFNNHGSLGFSTPNVATTLTLTTADINGRGTLNALIQDNGTGAAGVSISGPGEWDLNAANTYTGATIIDGSLTTLTQLGNGGVASNIGASSNAAGNLILNGAEFIYAGSATSTDRLFTLGPAGATIVASLTGNGLLQFTNTGAIALSGPNLTRTLSLMGSSGLLASSLGDSGSGATSLTVSNGSWTLTGNSAYTGVTTVTNGTLITNSLANGGVNSSLGASSNAAGNIVIDGALLQYTGSGASTDRLFTLGGTGSYSNGITGGEIDSSGTGTLNFTNSGAIAFSTPNKALSLTLGGTNTGNNTLAAVLGDNGTGAVSLYQFGSGTWVLGGSNTYTGTTVINGGVLAVSTLSNGGVASNLGASSNAAGNLVLAGGTLKYTGAGGSTDRLFTLGQVNGSYNGTIDVSGTGALSFLNSGAVTLSGTNTARTLTLTGTNTGANTLAAVLGDNGSGATSLVKSGVGTWVLSGANTYTGATTINGGVLSVASLANGGSASNLGASSNVAANLVLNGGTLQFTGGALRTSSDRLFTLGTAGGTIDGAGSGTLSLTNTGAIALSGTNTARTLTLTGTGGFLVTRGGVYYTTLAAALGDNGSGATSLVKNGSGVWALTGSNTYTGGTTVNAGVLYVGTGGTAGSILGDVTNNASLEFTRSDNTSYAGIISGSGNLYKAGTGTLTLAGLNTYTGTTTSLSGILAVSQFGNGGVASNLGASSNAAANLVLYGGTLQYTGAAASSDRLFSLGSTAGSALDASGSGALNLTNTGAVAYVSSNWAQTLTLAGTNTGANTLAASFADNGTGLTNLIKSGTGTWVLSGNSTYTGGTTISAGTLVDAGSSALGTGAVTVASGSTLQLQGNITAANSLTLNGTGTANNGALENVSGNNTASGAITLGSATRINSDAGTLTLSNTLAYGGYALTLGGAGNMAANGVISGTGSLTKDGAGTATLSGVNTYTGVTTINGGVLSVASLANGGSASNLGASSNVAANLVLNGGTLQLTNNFAATDRLFTLGTSGGTLDASSCFLFSFTNTGAIALSGTNTARTLTLNADSSSTGLLKLVLGDNGTGATSLNVTGSGGWVLGGNNTYTGNTTIGSGSYLAIGNHGTSGAVAGDVIDNGELSFRRVDSFGYGGIVSGSGVLSKFYTGTLTLSGNNTSTGATSVMGGILSVASLANGGVTSNIGASSNAAANLVLNGGTFQYTGAAASSDRLFTLGTTAGSGLDASGSGALNFTNTGAIAFTSANTSQTLTLAGTNTGANTLAAVLGDNGSGATSLVKSGVGTWVLSGSNTYTGTTTINGGRLQISSLGNGGTASSVGAATNAASNLVLNGGTLQLNGFLTTTDRLFTLGQAGGTIDAGSGVSVQFTNTGAIALSGTNTARSLVLTGSYAASYLASTLGDNGTGATSLIKSGANAWYLTGNNTYTGGTTINAGALAIGNFGTTGSIVGNVTNNATLGFLRSDNLGFAGLISGTGNFIQQGAGTLTLSGANSYTGTTSVLGGVLSVASLANGGSASNIGASSNAAANLVLNGGTLQYTGAAASSDRLFTLGTTAGNTLDASGSGALNLSNTGAIVLNGTNTARFLTLTGANTGANTLAASLGDNGSGATGLSKIGYGTWILAGANTHSGVTTITGGSLQLGNNLALQNSIFDPSGAGSLTFSSGVNTPTIGGLSSGTNLTLASNVTGLTLNPGSGVTATYSGVLGSATAGMILTKTGAGKQILSGTNTYSGATTVHAGTLALGSVGSIANSTTLVVGDAGSSGAVLDVSAKGGGFTIGATQTLKGIGTVNVGSGKTLTVSGTHAPGNSAGLQAVTGNLNYAAGSIFEWELASNITTGPGTNFDAVSVSGNLTLDETPTSGAVFKVVLGVNFNPADTFWLTSKSWNVFTVAGTDTTAFKNFQLFNAGASTTSIDYSNYGNFNYSFGSGTGTLNWTAVPEPTSALAGLLLGAGLLRCRK